MRKGKWTWTHKNPLTLLMFQNPFLSGSGTRDIFIEFRTGKDLLADLRPRK